MKAIDAKLLQKMIIAGANEITTNKDLVDSLNVFPVPDGDTGTNMYLTTLAAAKEVEKLENPSTVEEVAKAASSGALRGARGNSGVILSQLFRGFAKGAEGKKEIDADTLVLCLKKGSETAYKAVMKPKEGTMLTLARMLADKVSQLNDETDDLDYILKEGIVHCYKVLEMTTDMLPQLKQAGVIDAGGKGLTCIFEGAVNCIGNVTEIKVSAAPQTKKSGFSALTSITTESITFGYCTEFFINSRNIDPEKIKKFTEYISTIGDSIVVVHDDDIVKVHVHTDHPGLVLERAIENGSLSSLKIDNMREQHNNIIDFDESPKKEAVEAFRPFETEKETGVVVVSSGSGLSEIFNNLGADVIISGGQTMNPSTEEIVEAAKKVNAKNIIILPNNKNIILAAEQATFMLPDKKIYIIPTKFIPQGLSALVTYRPDLSVDENMEKILESIQNVKTGQITRAVRGTVYNGNDIQEGDILGLLEGKIEVVEKDIKSAALSLISKMTDENSTVLSIYYGDTASEEEALALGEAAIANFPEIELEVQSGQQPVYSFIISVE